MHDSSAIDPQGATRRTFIRGIAASGASTAAAVALDSAGFVDLFADNAEAQTAATAFSDFTALAPSSADALQVPAGYRADVVIKAGDSFANADGTTLKWGYNNDFLAFFPLDGKTDEGLLFSNFEYPDPFFVHGNPSSATKTSAQVKLEQDTVGNAILHVKRGADDVWRVVSPSPYNRRITGAAPVMPFTGPLADNGFYPGVGKTVAGSLANCSGGITPWGTALSCEENYDYFLDYGWTPQTAGTNDYFNGDGSNSVTQPAKYGWVVEHDPYDPSDTGRKHTALGRFRHENTAFRHVAGKPFVLYMGDDKVDEGIYKFVSTREFRPHQRTHNLKILTEGTLYVARFEPGGQRTFAKAGDTVPTSPTSGTGKWIKVEVSELVDTSPKLRARIGNADFNKYFATNRPEDVEVHRDGTVFVALTNNSNVRDSHGSVRRMVEAGNDPTALSFTWDDYAAGGPRGGADPARQGFSSPDNLVFDSQDNVWVVTDISSSRLNKENEYKYHANNAMFVVPTKGPNTGVAFRFANGPIEAELTGPYFTPDERTLFLNVQHPGEETRAAGGKFGDASTYTSYWPLGNKTTKQNPSAPLPSLVAITKVKPTATDPGSPIVPPPAADAAKPKLALLFAAPQSLGRLRGAGVRLQLSLDEAASVRATLTGRLKGSRKRRTLARTTLTGRKGKQTLVLRPSTATRVLLRRQRSLDATLEIVATDAAGNVTRRTKSLKFRI